MGRIEPVIARKETKKKTTKRKTVKEITPWKIKLGGRATKTNPRKVASGHNTMEKKKTKPRKFQVDGAGNLGRKTAEFKKKSAAAKKGWVTRKKNERKTKPKSSKKKSTKRR